LSSGSPNKAQDRPSLGLGRSREIEGKYGRLADKEYRGTLSDSHDCRGHCKSINEDNKLEVELKTNK